MSIHASHRNARRAGGLLAAVLACLASGTTPAIATARGDGVGCRLHEHIAYVTIDAGQEALISRTAAGVILVNGNPCGGLSLKPADVWNTKQIRIEGDNGGEEVTINLGNGGFAPGYGDEAGDTDEIEFILLMGQGWDRLDIEGTAGADEIAFGSKQGAWVPTPAINLNGDGDHDVLYQSADFVIAWGYGGNDTLTGNDPSTGTAFLPIRLTGGSGNDMLTGGSAADVLWGDGGNDTLKGGQGNDKLYTKDGVDGNDSANGGAGTDICISDPEDFQSAC